MPIALFRATRIFIIGAGMLSVAAGAAAQPAETKETRPGGAPVVKEEYAKGEVVFVGKSSLVVKMIPDGDLRVLAIPPGTTFTIDGEAKTLSEIQTGTVLTAQVTVTETPLIERTTTVTKGKIFWVSPTSVIVTLENGETKQYAVKPDFKFDVEGEKVSATQLRRGMHLTGTRVVEEPILSISRDTVVTGTAPK